jgi:glutamate-1-semialdehyde 2,1-aminomutase
VVNVVSSSELFRLYGRVSPGGVQSNIRFWAPNPIYFSRALGSRVWSIDGVEYVDLITGYGSVILGHGDPLVKKTVEEALEASLTTGLESELAYKVVDLIHSMVPSAEMVRLSVTGTEAVMHALMIARAATGRLRIVKAEGCYHGWYDQVYVSLHPPLDKAGPRDEPNVVPISRGIHDALVSSVIVIPFNDADALRRVLTKHKNEVAAFIIEPICFNSGVILPRGDYLREVREITESNDVLLIFDEVITGFRIAPGGAQEYYGVKPDLSIFGKAMANGFPISAVAGREDLMRLTEPGGLVGYAGTYNGNYISAAAAYATLIQLRSGDVQGYLNSLTNELVRDLSRLFGDYGVEARVYGIGGQFQVYFTNVDVVDYRTAATTDVALYSRFREALMNSHYLMHPDPLFHHGLTKAHTGEEVRRIIEITEEFLRKIKTSGK